MKKTNQITVFIASPGDTDVQRNEVENLILKWNRRNRKLVDATLVPIRWEKDSIASYQKNVSGQSIINKQILSDSDILIAIFNKKLGTPVDGYQSGTDQEIKVFFEEKGDHIGIFFNNIWDPENGSVFKNSREIGDYHRLSNYKEEVSNMGLYLEYSEDNILNFITEEVRKLLSNIESSKPDNNNISLDLFDSYQYDLSEQLFLIFCIESETRIFRVSSENEYKKLIESIQTWENKNNLKNIVSSKILDILETLSEQNIVDNLNENNDKKINHTYYLQIKKNIKEQPEKINGLKLRKTSVDLTVKNQPKTFYLNRFSSKSQLNIHATLEIHDDNNFIVLKGSLIEPIDSESIPQNIKEYRKNATTLNNILQENTSFNSISAAACFVIGGHANGKTEWKSKDGITYKDLQTTK